uniref:Uncharacterized protein n=1 Tax=Chromera velia CCMP2878 TaxID=1169474 RepID=A0A0G4GWM7_9ALVE|eukprot:Cvel_5323.t1-p1 / transcript=Cvel_5323.t1 / gene=Cvel_5323 / organism=Chromera_velia_CCMP2878 / gene_product=hypothetical protein / transcript_product=hypothetical protein / location=Cvel_scaffold246:104012-106478(+) / protein_length=222 / sequence_SO=supercontig / SO=protein_coding / is_pseudo=false
MYYSAATTPAEYGAAAPTQYAAAPQTFPMQASTTPQTFFTQTATPSAQPVYMDAGMPTPTLMQPQYPTAFTAQPQQTAMQMPLQAAPVAAAPTLGAPPQVFSTHGAAQPAYALPFALDGGVASLHTQGMTNEDVLRAMQARDHLRMREVQLRLLQYDVEMQRLQHSMEMTERTHMQMYMNRFGNADPYNLYGRGVAPPRDPQIFFSPSPWQREQIRRMRMQQ